MEWSSGGPKNRQAMTQRMCNDRSMNGQTQLAAALLLLVGAVEFSIITPALARGGAPSIMNSPGYQRRLQESRKPDSRPHVQTPAIDPRKQRRHRHHRQ
jgi:hypothetical protein